MNCTVFEHLLFLGFAISIVAANIASWRMQKFAKLSGYRGPQWKLLLGDVALPASTLSGNGILWRKASIGFFISLLVFSAGIAVLKFNGSQCFAVVS